MKFLKAHYILLICFCLCVTGLLFAALGGTASEGVPVDTAPPGPQNSAQQLAEAELALQEHRAELAAMLRAYYMGHGDERETQALIDRVEAERLHVEELRKTVTF